LYELLIVFNAFGVSKSGDGTEFTITVALPLFGCWLSGSLVIQISLAVWLNLLRIQQN